MAAATAADTSEIWRWAERGERANKGRAERSEKRGIFPLFRLEKMAGGHFFAV
jgi:hypothetical protein